MSWEQSWEMQDPEAFLWNLVHKQGRQVLGIREEPTILPIKDMAGEDIPTVNLVVTFPEGEVRYVLRCVREINTDDSGHMMFVFFPENAPVPEIRVEYLD